jgi:hypothetical protein
VTAPSPFAPKAQAQPAQGSPFGQQATAPIPTGGVVSTSTSGTGSRFATKRDRPDRFPTAQDLMPSAFKGTDGALVIIRVEGVQRGLKSKSNNGTYDAFKGKVWILDAPLGLPRHVLEAGEQRDDAYYLPEMQWTGAGLVRDLEGPLEQRQLFVGRVGAYENTRNPRDPMSPEFNMATDDELARAEAYVNAHPEVDYPKTTFARAS